MTMMHADLELLRRDIEVALAHCNEAIAYASRCEGPGNLRDQAIVELREQFVDWCRQALAEASHRAGR